MLPPVSVILALLFSFDISRVSCHVLYPRTATLAKPVEGRRSYVIEEVAPRPGFYEKFKQPTKTSNSAAREPLELLKELEETGWSIGHERGVDERSTIHDPAFKDLLDKFKLKQEGSINVELHHNKWWNQKDEKGNFMFRVPPTYALLRVRLNLREWTKEELDELRAGPTKEENPVKERGWIAIDVMVNSRSMVQGIHYDGQVYKNRIPDNEGKDAQDKPVKKEWPSFDKQKTAEKSDTSNGAWPIPEHPTSDYLRVIMAYVESLPGAEHKVSQLGYGINCDIRAWSSINLIRQAVDEAYPNNRHNNDLPTVEKAISIEPANEKAYQLMLGNANNMVFWWLALDLPHLHLTTGPIWVSGENKDLGIGFTNPEKKWDFGPGGEGAPGLNTVLRLVQDGGVSRPE